MKISKHLRPYSDAISLRSMVHVDSKALQALQAWSGVDAVVLRAHAGAFHEAEASGLPALHVPTIWALAYAVREASITSAGYLPPAVYRGEDRWVDCRLQVDASGWKLHTGPSDFDLDHRGYWGASSYRAESRPVLSTCLDTAAELLEQVMESIGESASVDHDRWALCEAFEAMAPWLHVLTRRSVRR